MRPDQQNGEKPAGVLGVLASIWSVGLVGENVNDFEQARDAVAEYIAANDEYDAALTEKWDMPSPVDDETIDRVVARFKAAVERRVLAHARMKGEK